MVGQRVAGPPGPSVTQSGVGGIAPGQAGRLKLDLTPGAPTKQGSYALGTTYKFQVVALNEAGGSQPSPFSAPIATAP